jgi:hypothetical protein
MTALRGPRRRGKSGTPGCQGCPPFATDRAAKGNRGVLVEFGQVGADFPTLRDHQGSASVGAVRFFRVRGYGGLANHEIRKRQ